MHARIYNPPFFNRLTLLLVTAAWLLDSGRDFAQDIAPVSDTNNYGVGTQIIGPAYQKNLDNHNLLVLGAQDMLKMGSNMIKFGMTPRYVDYGYVKAKDPAIHNLVELARDESCYRQVFAMPFAYYFIWTYTFATDGGDTPWSHGFGQEKVAAEYKEMYALTRYLLTTYNGTGKTFFLGHWEGDWHLIAGSPPNPHKWERVPRPEAVRGMIAWLNARQAAIDDAKRDTPHHNVQVYHYSEVNLVQKGMAPGVTVATVAKDVLPHTNVDYISYSSYDSTSDDQLHVKLPAALDYLESKLKPKPDIAGKRVFIGEYTCPARIYDPRQQDARMRDVIETSLQWGTPFILYWELYNNVVDAKGKQGVWLIDDVGTPQPVYDTYQSYYKAAKKFVADATQKEGHAPSEDEIHAFALDWFSHPGAAASTP